MKSILTRILTLIICLFIIFFVIINFNNLTNKLLKIFNNTKDIIIPPTSKYKCNDEYLFVKNVDDFVPLSKGDIKNIYYTIINNGYKDFTFYCPEEYKSCIEDIKTISNDKDLLTHINSFAKSYNSFTNITTTIDLNKEIHINVTYLYNDDDINKINEKVDEIYNELITDDMNNYDKILKIHDYIINNANYDVERNNNGTSKYKSYMAIGPLFEGYATCSGYTDLMSIFLDKMNIKNYKIATTPSPSNKDGHVWNAVYLDNEWLHLDLTWDDPVSRDGKDYLQHKYFLINNEELEQADNGEVKISVHNYEKSIYLEFK